MTQSTIRWTTDPHVVKTIADDSFGGWEQAFVEAIKNSLDAGATRISVQVPTKEILVDGAEQVVVVEDNGNGMILDELRDDYCRFGRFKPGHRGTGKVATFKVVQQVRLTTWRDGSRHRMTFSTGDILVPQKGSEPSTAIRSSKVKAAASGTRLELVGFRQHLAPPTESQVHQVLLRSFHHLSGTSFLVNGVAFDPSTHASEVLNIEDQQIEGVGRASLVVLIAESRGALALPGLMVYCDGQRVHGPDLFGLENKGYSGDAEKLTRRLLGRLDLDPVDHQPIDSGAWTLTAQHQLLAEWAGDRLVEVVNAQTKEVVDARVEDWLRDRPTKRYFDRLAPDEQSAARRILGEQARKSKGASSSAQTVINRLVCRSLSTDALAVVLDVLQDSTDEEIEDFSGLFQGKDRWTLRQVTRAASMVKHHIQALADLEACVADYSSNESQIHEILRENSWIIADDYHSFRSNRQIRTTLRKVFGIDVDDPECLKRPDFFFVLGDAASSAMAQEGRFLLVELKGPDQPLDESHQLQVVGDAKRFLRYHRGFAYCTLLGTEFHPTKPPDPDVDSKGVYTFRSMTYMQLIERARFRLEYVAEGVRDSGAEEFARRVLRSQIERLVDTSTKRGKKAEVEVPSGAGPEQ